MAVDAEALDRLRRLRALGLRRGAEGLAPRPAPAAAGGPGGVPGEPVDTPYGPAWLRTARYPLAERPDLAPWLGLAPEILAALAGEAGAGYLAPATAAFIDTETTGLSTGTGTYTFLIGIGTFELEGDPAFVVRQYFMRSPAEERAQLHLVEERLAGCQGAVTFNGRSFDMPLIQNRFILARLPLPLVGAPHLDLLPPARRLWRARIGSCALSELERNILAKPRSADDVPGWLIPTIYHDYYRGGHNAEMMARVFYHNLEDVVSMVLLGVRMAETFARPYRERQFAGLHPLECASLARWYAALEWHEVGEAAYRAALDGPLSDGERAQVFRELSFLLKRLGRRAEAATVWEEWISSVPGEEMTPYVELAKHHEWYTGDVAVARSWTAWALRIGESRPAGAADSYVLAELRHRLARLERKLAAASPPGTEEP
jgi:uncharacterized protein YprB with RNaseH-like and TPR domain